MNGILGNVTFLTRTSASCRTKDLVCLNFKVPLRVRQQFKVCAARHNMTMTELLLQFINECAATDSNSDDSSAPPIKK